MWEVTLIRKVPPVSSPADFELPKTAGGDTGGTNLVAW